jgi:putative membrane protein
MKKIFTFVVASLIVAALPVGVAVARASSVSGLDEESLTTSMKGDLFEVAGGKIAESKSHNPAVLRLARTLIKDHSQEYAQSAALARRLGIEVPTEPTMSMVWELKVASRMREHTFNHWWSSLEALDHEQDISDTTDEVNNGHNHDIRQSAKQSLPMLHRHLNLARAALAASK